MFLLKCAHEFSWILEGLYDSQLTQKNMEATPFCPLVDLFLRGVAKLKDLQDEVSYVLVIHLEASIISVMVATMRRCLLHLANSRAQHKTGGSLTSMDVSAMLDRSPRRSLARASGRTTFPQVW